MKPLQLDENKNKKINEYSNDSNTLNQSLMSEISNSHSNIDINQNFMNQPTNQIWNMWQNMTNNIPPPPMAHTNNFPVSWIGNNNCNSNIPNDYRTSFDFNRQMMTNTSVLSNPNNMNATNYMVAMFQNNSHESNQINLPNGDYNQHKKEENSHNSDKTSSLSQNPAIMEPIFSNIGNKTDSAEYTSGPGYDNIE